MAKRDSQEQEQPNNGEPTRRLSALDRVIIRAVGDGRTVGLEDDPARTDYPAVWEWLTKIEAKDYVMQGATIAIQLGPEGVLVTITHRDLKASCSVACPYLSQVYEALQAALSSPNPPIRSWGKDPQVQLKRRRQKP